MSDYYIQLGYYKLSWDYGHLVPWTRSSASGLSCRGLAPSSSRSRLATKPCERACELFREGMLRQQLEDREGEVINKLADLTHPMNYLACDLPDEPTHQYHSTDEVEDPQRG